MLAVDGIFGCIVVVRNLLQVRWLLLLTVELLAHLLVLLPWLPAQLLLGSVLLLLLWSLMYYLCNVSSYLAITKVVSMCTMLLFSLMLLSNWACAWIGKLIVQLVVVRLTDCNFCIWPLYTPCVLGCPFFISINLITYQKNIKIVC